MRQGNSQPLPKVAFLQDFVVMKLKIGQWLLIELKYSMLGSVVPLAMFEIYDIS